MGRPLFAPRRQSEHSFQDEILPAAGGRSGREVVRALRLLVVLLGVISLPCAVCAQQPAPLQKRSGDPYTIEVNVDVVVLHATALAHDNVLVSGLGKDDFQVYEDGVLQKVTYFSHEDIPVTVGLVIDNSGSMRSKRAGVIAAALVFAQSSNPQDQMFVVNFNEKVSFGLPDATPFTDQTAQLQDALARITTDGETALYDAVAVALEHLKKGNRDKKVLIIVSDGGDNASKRTLAQIADMAVKSEAIIYTIGIFDEMDGDQNPHVLRQLAKNTGGEAFLPESVDQIVPICERIAHDIRNQYTIAYVPTNRKRDGSYRAIQVKASAPGRGRLSIRTRTGYVAPAASTAPATKAVGHEIPN